MAFNRKLLVTAAVCATAMVGLTACGNDSAKSEGKQAGKSTASEKPADPFKGLTAQEISDKAEEATRSAQSLKVKGTGTSDGEQMDIAFAVNRQEQCQATVGMQGGEAEILQVDSVMYMKADEAFWQQMAKSEGGSQQESDAMVEMLKGRWMKLPNDPEAKKDMGGACDLDTLLEEDATGGSGKITRGKDTEVDGQPAATLVEKDGKETTTVYVAKEGKPYALKIVTVGGDEPHTMVFSDYDKPLDVKAPPADQVVDLEKMMSEGAGA